MKKAFLLGSIAALALSSCVTLSEHENLKLKYDQNIKQQALTQQELEELKEENASLVRQNNALTSNYTELTTAKTRSDRAVDSLSRSLEKLRHDYDTTMENYLQQVAGKNRDLAHTQNLLSSRTRELNDKEELLRQKEIQFQQQQEIFLLQRSEMVAKQKELEEQEASTRAQLEAKEREVESVRNAVTNALVGFTDKGLRVETKEGKVYVSMENKLMFPSASWTVSKEGVNAIKELAKVLEQDASLNIMVEGHTDNDAYRGSTAVKDNWDLSVMRATAIVKLILQYGPGINPSRIEACGHGEFAPRASNETAEGKAANRRTEIILTPDLDKLLQQIGH
ncbi:MAG: OmpA family protein [bacterium]